MAVGILQENFLHVLVVKVFQQDAKRTNSHWLGLFSIFHYLGVVIHLKFASKVLFLSLCYLLIAKLVFLLTNFLLLFNLVFRLLFVSS